MTNPGDDDARRLSASYLAAGEPTGWFEELYAEASNGAAAVPWDRGAPNASLVGWADGLAGAGRRAIVVGCGYGRDSEYLASLGFDTTAFDVARTAIAAAQARHPDSTVHYAVADLLALPARWHAAFDLVVESHNVQSLPPELHPLASAAVASLVADAGTLLVLAAAGDGTVDGPPWPLTRAEIEGFAGPGLRTESIEQIVVDGIARWRAEFRR